ncbi:Maspardin [Morella rubra]|uniref:Maspardin n=1 Tax=Morella rubra TaxID=262757 RepID=A0A6A1VVU9_9ROSI|nr:Maspardin [Morella rubra]
MNLSHFLNEACFKGMQFLDTQTTSPDRKTCIIPVKYIKLNFLHPCTNVSWTPSFLLKRYVLTGIRDGPHEPFIADSVDFVVSQHLKDELSERYPEARRAYLKSGGDFPFLSRPDEVNLHLQLHLRRVGVEARPDLVRGIPKGGSGGSPGEENDGKEDDPDDPPKDDGEPSEGPSTDSQLHPAPESSESHTLDDQLLKNARLCHLDHADVAMLYLPRVWKLFFLRSLLTYSGSLYITLNCCRKVRHVV